jgi:hypothetical protein
MELGVLKYGVPRGVIIDPFYRDACERQKVTGWTSGRERHLGIDVSFFEAPGGGADDPRRGSPVYATPKPSIDLHELNNIRVFTDEGNQKGLGIVGQGSAVLNHAIVLVQPWQSRKTDSSYGGVIGLAYRYDYTKLDASLGRFTLYTEYLHLITSEFLPKDGEGKIISADVWAAMNKGIGFGAKMQNNRRLTQSEMLDSEPILIGYLGALPSPHVHIQTAFGYGDCLYMRRPRFDPAVTLL